MILPFDPSTSERIHRHTCDNQVQLVVQEMPMLYSVSAGFFVRLGSRYEEGLERGVAHYLEHMLLKGSSRYTAREAMELVEGYGGQLNAYTTEEVTCFHVKTLPQYLFPCLEVLYDMLTAPTLSEEEFEKERSVIIEEWNSYEDAPASFLQDWFPEVMWGAHPLGNRILGTLDNLQNFSCEQVQRCYREAYTAPNVGLVLSGPVAMNEVQQWLDERQGGFAPGKRNIYTPLSSWSSIQHDIQVTEREIEQCYIQIGFPCCSRFSEESWSLRVLDAVLGDTMSSRLFQVIREELGLAYYVSSDLELYDEVGCWSIQCGVDKERVNETIEQCLAVVEGVGHPPLSEEEVTRAKRYLISTAIQALESTSDAMSFLGDALLAGEENLTTHAYCQKIAAVTLDDVLNAQKLYLLRSRCRIAVVGNINQLSLGYS